MSPVLTAAPPPRRLSAELQDLAALLERRPVTLREVIYRLRGRAYLLIVVLLALPFIAPVPLPGLSTPFGLVIVAIALRLTLGSRPWLPKKLQRKELPPAIFKRVFALSGRFLRIVETLLRPRLAAVTHSQVLLRAHAAVILLSAAVLLLPLPIPLSNALPAWAILLVASGLTERDGVFIVVGYVVFAAAMIYLVLLGGATVHALQVMWHWLVGFISPAHS